MTAMTLHQPTSDKGFVDTFAPHGEIRSFAIFIC